jgi:hypothetical protein
MMRSTRFTRKPGSPCKPLNKSLHNTYLSTIAIASGDLPVYARQQTGIPLGLDEKNLKKLAKGLVFS